MNLPFAVCGEGQRGLDVFPLKIGKILHNLLRRHAPGQVIEDIVNRDPQAADARLSSALVRFNRAKLWEGRALIGGKVSKVTTNFILTTNVIKKALGLALDAEEEKVEKAHLWRRCHP